MRKLSIKILALFLIISGWAISQPVIVGSGTGVSVFSPINRSNDYCVYEVIYLAGDINISGPVSAVGFQRVDGTNTDSIENVRIYLQHTSQTILAAGSFSTAGYSLVFDGSWPNDSGSGWRERIMDSVFTYNGTSNLKVLIVKDYQPAIANTPVTPRWYYTNVTTGDRARRYYGAVPITTSTALSTTGFTSNIRLTFGTVGVVEINPGIASVYPNPSKGDITFTLPDEELYTTSLIVCNSLGQCVFSQKKLNGSKTTVSNLRPGVYFYNVFNDKQNSIYKGKFIVE